jgi:hypothetical protein
MNLKFNRSVWSLALVMITASATGAGTNTVAARIGVYDSRAIAYAWFVSAAQMAQLKQEVAAARAAKDAGNDAKFKVAAAALQAKQDQMHREVFSTAPAAEALAALDGKTRDIEQAVGVTALISRWDDAALDEQRGAEQVDVTDSMVRALCQPDAKQLKMIESIKKAKPLPLRECNELIRKGKI